MDCLASVLDDICDYIGRLRDRRGSEHDRGRVRVARHRRRRVADAPVARALRAPRAGDARARDPPRQAPAPPRLGTRDPRDQGDRGRGRPGRARRAGGLFKDDRIDPGIVIRWKGIYEALEDAVDACDTAANRIGNILVKNAEAGRRRGGVAANRHETGTETAQSRSGLRARRPVELVSRAAGRLPTQGGGARRRKACGAHRPTRRVRHCRDARRRRRSRRPDARCRRSARGWRGASGRRSHGGAS